LASMQNERTKDWQSDVQNHITNYSSKVDKDPKWH
jgi:hypothetical protein